MSCPPTNWRSSSGLSAIEGPVKASTKAQPKPKAKRRSRAKTSRAKTRTQEQMNAMATQDITLDASLPPARS